LEFKTTKLPFTTTSGRKDVMCGSADYYTYVPLRFRSQLLHQAFVCGLRHSLLIVSSPSVPGATVLIAYTEAQLEAYKNFLSRTSIATAFSWFTEACALKRTSAQVIKRIPQTSNWARAILASHVNRVRALTLFVAERGAPLPEISHARPWVQHAYQRTKPWLDQLSQSILSFAGNFGSRAGAGSVIVRELFHILVYAVLRGERVQYAAPHISTLGLDKARVLANQHFVSFPDQAHELLGQLVHRPSVFTSAVQGVLGGSEPVPVPRHTAAAVPGPYQGERPLAVLADLVPQAQGGTTVELVAGFPVAASLVRGATPVKSTFGPDRIQRMEAWATLFRRNAPDWSSQRKTKLSFWVGGDGDGIRLYSKLLHVSVDMAGAPSARPKRMKPELEQATPSEASSAGAARRRGKCVVCLAQTTTACVLCGTALCGACFGQFHTVEAEELRARLGDVAASEDTPEAASTPASVSGVGGTAAGSVSQPHFGAVGSPSG
jgi:hypothetical protein